MIGRYDTFIIRFCVQRLFLILFISVDAQSYKEDPLLIEDFNNDMVLDTLYSFYESGSTFGGTHVKIVNGQNNEVYELSNYGCYCEMKRVYLIPEILSMSENKTFLSVFQKRLFPEPKNIPDLSLQWIIKGYSSNKKLSENKYFDLIINPRINWSTEKIEIPDSYNLILKDDLVSLLFKEKDSVSDINYRKAFLSYCGHCHLFNRSSPELVADNDRYKIYKTSHGVFVEKNGLQKWFLVNDIGLTGSPEKLRWDSILQVVLMGKYLVIQFSGAPDMFDNIFVGNIETGVVGRLNFLFRDHVKGYDESLVVEDKIRYNNEDEVSFFVNCNDVFKELERLYGLYDDLKN
ncbi:hypothetical protein [Aquimarina sp. LLG6339-5]|uniref:hypothetical protein n=1 Tax=Aquimarina sp. LLG6339-5 TaxID=3160830 RepID=UPI003867E5C7